MNKVIILVFSALILFCCNQPQVGEHREMNTIPIPGAWQLDSYLPLLQGKQIGLVVNPSSTISDRHLVDTLAELRVNIKTIFAPEHGFRGEADPGQKIENSIDQKTGIPVISLYGKHRQPTPKEMADLDVVVFDIQDVGLRFYTFISTMHYVMQACAENHKSFIVLDRPNPNGYYVDGPVLDSAFQSFVGMHPIPMIHGLTVGELARMINGEGWLGNMSCSLTVIPVKYYDHSTRYSLPVKPSPNLPNDRSIQLYASLCLFEPTKMSIGRGTLFPFQVIGFPDSSFGEFSFTPRSIPGMATHPKYEEKQCFGVDLRTNDSISSFTLSYLLKFYHRFNDESFFTNPHFFDLLAGTDQMRKQLLAGYNEKAIRKTWQPALEKYLKMRKKYLLYPDVTNPLKP